MTGFDDRRKGFEAKWAHDADLQFKISVRRNKALGIWAAAEKGLSGAAADEFATSIINSDFQKPGDEDVFEKLRAELPPSVSDATIRDKMRNLLEETLHQAAAESA